MHIPLAKPTHNFNSTSSGVRVEVPAKKQWFRAIFMLFWLSIWATGWLTGASTWLSTFASAGINVFMTIWLTIWTIGGLTVVLSLLWNFLGRETIEIDQQTLSLRYAILGIGFTRRYRLADCTRLRVSSTPPVSAWNGRSRQSLLGESGTLSVSYGPRTVRFARDMDEAEATQLADKLRARFPSLA